MEETSCLIVFEKSMEHRYAQMATIHGFSLHTVGMDNTWQNSLFENLKLRIRSKRIVKEKADVLFKNLRKGNFKNIYLSNAEGYISKNLIHSIRKEFPSLKLIALQHGVFPLKQELSKEFIRKTINKVVYGLTGIFPLGAGFGGLVLDGYYVYSNREKDFLVSRKGWDPSNVLVDIRFIKPEVYNEYVTLKKTYNKDGPTAVFLLQGLHLAGLCSLKNETNLIEQTIKHLSERYKNVLLKEHPACKGRLDSLMLPENVSEESSLFEAFSKANDAYSFFSTALIDAKIFNLKTFGISSKHIKVDEEIYDNFDIKIDFEKTIAS